MSIHLHTFTHTHTGITLHPTPPTPVTVVPPAPPPSSVAPTHTHPTTEANLGLRTKLRPAVPSVSNPPPQLTKAFNNGGDIPTQQVAWTRKKRLPGPSKAIEVEINHSSFESDSGHLSAQDSEVMESVPLSTGNPESPGQVAGSGQSHELGQTSNHLPPWEGIQHELNGLSLTQKEPSHSSYAEMDEDSYGTYRVGGNGHFERRELESSDSESGSENNSYKIVSHLQYHSIKSAYSCMILLT